MSQETTSYCDGNLKVQFLPNTHFLIILSYIHSDDAKQQIAFILEKISALRPAEKLLLYLKMPGGHSEVGEW